MNPSLFNQQNPKPLPAIAFNQKPVSATKMNEREAFSHFAFCLTHFKSFKMQDLEGLNKYWDVKKIKKNQYFIKEGEAIQNYGFIIQGAMKIFRKHGSADHMLALLTEANFCNSKNLFYLKDLSNYNAYCIEPTIVVTINHENMLRLITKRPVFLDFFTDQNEQAILFLQNRLTSLQLMTAQERYEDLLNNTPEILSRFNIRDVASYLGMKAETLSRVRNNASRSPAA